MSAHPPAQSSHPPAAPKGGIGQRLRAVGGWLSKRPLVAFPSLALVVLAIIGGGYAATRVLFSAKPAVVQSGSAALAKLDAGDFAAARNLAIEMGANQELSHDELGGPMFVLGVVMMQEADEHLDSQKRQLLFRVAARYLEEARSRGFPEGREAEGLRRLGESLHGAGRYAQSVPVLRQAIEEAPEHASQLRWLLIEACQKLHPPDLAAAEAELTKYLEDPQLAARDRQTGLLKLAEIQLAAGNPGGSRETLRKLEEADSLPYEAGLLEARSHLHEADEAGEDQPEKASASIAAALAVLQQLDLRDAAQVSAAAQAQYLTALCRLRAKEFTAAEEQFLRVRQSHYGTEEALAATLHSVELAQRQGRMEEALELAREFITESPPIDSYQNRWISLEEAQHRLSDMVAQLTTQGEYDQAIALATILPPFVAEAEMLALRAQAHAAASHKFRTQAAQETYLQAGMDLAEARAHDRLAGADYARLAQLRFITKHYEDDLWNSAASYLAGQAYAAAAKHFREILRQESRYRRPEVLVGLGQSLLALGKAGEAVEVLERCLVEYPKHPASYRARLYAAYAAGELGQLAEARQKLNDNLYGFSLTPESAEWRDSLFALGRLLMREGIELETKSRLEGVDSEDTQQINKGLVVLEKAHSAFEEAAKVLTEAVRRFPQAGDTVLARYRIAEAHRHAAKFPRKKLTVTTIETTRVLLNRQIQQELALALEEYGRLLAQLDQEQTTQQRNPLELQLVRNCYFERADVLFDLGRYDEALAAYSAASNRYQAEPEALEAYVQIAACYRRMDKLAEARGTLEQARVVLKRIRPDANFNRTTRYNREEWGTLLTWLGTL
jgi:tetratricopeptide (TPR) repeat protein